MDNLKTKSILIADWGLFAELAPRLAREFGQVRYWMPWASAYPRSVAAHVGFGLPGVERVATFWNHVPDADVVMFPDLYMADMAAVVAERFHKPVWSHRRAEFLELDRIGARRLQRDLGIPAPKSKVCHGIEALADYLEDHEDQWVKISCHRGDGETWHHETMHTTSVYLDHFINRVGALAEDYEFLVEETIEGVECGFDGWTVHGDFPEACAWGIEVKDSGYIGQFAPYSSFPEPIRFINAKMAPILREERAVGFCSFEFRYNKQKQAFMIDPCLRFGSPPTEGTMELYDNLGEIVWEGANGRMARAKPLGTFVCMAMIHCPFALTNWVPIECPPDVRRWLKLRNPVMLNKKLYHAPVGGEMPEIGAVVAVSDDLEEAKRLVCERAEQVKGFQLEIHVDALEQAQDEIDKAREFGIDF